MIGFSSMADLFALDGGPYSYLDLKQNVLPINVLVVYLHFKFKPLDEPLRHSS